jgi:CRISPR-associated protein Cas1
MEDSLYRTAMVSVGLDPNLSFIHQVGYGRQSLIYDLKELNRHQLDLFCFRLLSNNILMADHFVTSDSTGAVRLNEEGKRIYYQQWFRFARIHQQAIKKVVKLAKRVVLMETNNEQ